MTFVRSTGRAIRWSVLLIGILLHSTILGAAPKAIPAPGAVPPGRWAFRSYGSEQGLTNVAIWSLEQDRDGFLWVGSESGLFRYDGSRFQRYGLAEGLPADLVRVVHASRSGRLWLGTLRGAAVREGNRITALGAKAGLNDSEVFAFAEDAQHRVWVGSDHGLFRQKGGALSFEAMPGWDPQATARSIWLDAATAYVASGSSLYTYDLATGQGPRLLEGPWTERLDALARDARGRFWVRSHTHLWMQPAEGGPFQDMSRHLSGTALYDGSLTLDGHGTLLIPMADGLMRVTGDTWESIGDAQGLPTPWVNRALVDREGSLWACGTGLHRSLGGEAWRTYSQKDGIPASIVQSMMRDREGRFWVGTASGVCEAAPGGWKQKPESRDQAVLDMVQTADGALWLGGAPSLQRWLPGKNQWTTYNQVGSTIIDMQLEPGSGDLLLGTRRKGLWRVRTPDSAPVFEPVTLPGGARDERIQCLHTSAGGRTWVAGSLGLACLERGVWKRYTPAEGLGSLHVTAVLERGNGDIWLSYLASPGAFRYRLEQGRLVLKGTLDARTGLSSDQIHFLREDARGRLWIGTSLGVNMEDGTAVHAFGTGEGLPGDDTNVNAFFADPNGDVWIGSLGGLAHFRSEVYKGFPPPPPAHILSVQFRRGLLTAPFTYPVTVPYRDANPEFRFAGLSYINEAKVQHQIRLLGYESDWHATDIRQATYTNLPPGPYRFEVRSGYGGGVWGPPAQFSFRVAPAWWQTWAFRILAGMVLLGGIGFLVWLRVRALHDKNLRLDRLVNERTRELAEANKTLRQLTVTDPLTGLKNRRYLDLTIEEDLAKVHRDHKTLLKQQQSRMAVNIDLLFLMVDMDHFKQVNDTYGHSAGDSVLQQLRDRLLAAVRDTDTVIRWGGEEFLVLAKGTDRTQAPILAERILSLIRDVPFDVGGGVTITKTCSLGYAPYPFVESDPDRVTWHQVVDVADRCLYATKKSGRNGWVGVPACGTEPTDIQHFLDDPPGALADGTWDLASSFEDQSKLEW